MQLINYNIKYVLSIFFCFFLYIFNPIINNFFLSSQLKNNFLIYAENIKKTTKSQTISKNNQIKINEKLITNNNGKKNNKEKKKYNNKINSDIKNQYNNLSSNNKTKKSKLLNSNAQIKKLKNIKFVKKIAKNNSCIKQSYVPIQVEMVMNLNTGEILHEINSDKLFHPASLTKVMTAYIAFKHIAQGKITLDTEITTPKYASLLPRCKIDLLYNQKIKVIDLLKALIISSANDAAETLLFHLAGKMRENIPNLMNKQAKKLGMHNTNFVNASGLHHNEQKTTARDLMKLSYAIKMHFPNLYNLFSETYYEYNGKIFKGHNKITEQYEGAEGLKTGYIAKSGYNLISIAKRNNITLCAIIAGSKTKKERDEKMKLLLDKYFDQLNNNTEKS